MVTTTKKLTADDLWRMLEKERYELWHGELVEVSPAGMTSGTIAARLVIRVGAFIEAHDLGAITTAEGGFILFPSGDSVVAPDVGFIRWERLPDETATERFAPTRPDLAIEVLSPSDRPGTVRRKLALYMEAHVPLVWWVDPKKREIVIHRPDELPRTLRVGDMLEGEDVLPGFQLPVADVFAERARSRSKE